MGDSSNVGAAAYAHPEPGQPAKPVNPGPNAGAMAFTGLGGATTAYAQYAAAKAQKDIARSNSAIDLAGAQEANEAGGFNAAKAEAHGEQMASSARAAAAGQGQTAGAGTAGLVAANSEQAGAMNALMIQRNAAREAMGYQSRAASEQEQAIAAGAQETTAPTATLLNAGSQEWLESDSNYSGFRGRGITFQ
jgi:hypothetical protein